MFELQIKNLSKSYGPHRVLRDLSLQHSGRVLGIAGPNGSGKSTLMRCLAGLLKPDSGSITWRRDGQALTSGRLKEILGYAAPYVSLYEELSPRENLRFILRLRKAGGDRQTDSLLEWVGLKGRQEQPFGKLSTGQQQRVRLAAALVHKPDILLLDEPGANLDEQGHRLVEQIAGRFRDRHHMLVIASNNRTELDLCDTVFSVNLP